MSRVYHRPGSLIKLDKEGYLCFKDKIEKRNFDAHPIQLLIFQFTSQILHAFAFLFGIGTDFKTVQCKTKHPV